MRVKSAWRLGVEEGEEGEAEAEEGLRVNEV